jgi:Flp pilus assembly protein TadG
MRELRIMMTVLVRRVRDGFKRKCFVGRLVRFAADRSGNVAMLFGLAVIPLLIAMGGAVDYGRWLHARDQTIAAMDAAVLRGGRALQVDSEDAAAAITAAEKFYEENIKTRLTLLSDTVAFNIADDGTAMTTSGQAWIETTFLKLANIDKLPLLNGTGSDYSKATTGTGQNLELSIMLDVTGSMSGQKIADLKAAANDLIKIVVSDDQSKYTTKVGLVPFADAVRPGPDYLNKVRGNPQGTSRFKDDTGRWQTYKLTDCVSERDGNGAYTDIAPVGNDMVGPVYTRTGTCNPSSKNAQSPQDPVAVVPLTSDKNYLEQRINELAASGWTAGHLGTAWTWYLLSPNWSSIWPDSGVAPYGVETNKVAILMTDGEFNTQYDAAGITTREQGGGAKNGLSDSQTRAICENMKQTSINVYTVGFDLREGKAIETMRLCASTPEQAYLAEDGEQLRQAFRDIALKISALYLSK